MIESIQINYFDGFYNLRTILNVDFEQYYVIQDVKERIKDADCRNYIGIMSISEKDIICQLVYDVEDEKIVGISKVQLIKRTVYYEALYPYSENDWVCKNPQIMELPKLETMASIKRRRKKYLPGWSEPTSIDLSKKDKEYLENCKNNADYNDFIVYKSIQQNEGVMTETLEDSTKLPEREIGKSLIRLMNTGYIKRQGHNFWTTVKHEYVS
ncbi:hypothetical protein ACFL5V_13710 [Fibrobacterota bacterium]